MVLTLIPFANTFAIAIVLMKAYPFRLLSIVKLDILEFDTFNGFVTPAVFVIVVTPPVVLKLMPVPAVKLGLMSPVIVSAVNVEEFRVDILPVVAFKSGVVKLPNVTAVLGFV